MRLISLLQKRIVALSVVSISLIFTAVSLLVFDFQLGIDYSRTHVIEIELDQIKDINYIQDSVAEVTSSVERIESVQNKRFYIYLKDVTSEELNTLSSELIEVIDSEVIINTYIYEPATLDIVAQRVSAISVLILSLFVLFFIIKLKKLSLSYWNVLSLIISFGIATGFELFVTGAIAAAFQIEISEWSVSMLCLSFFVILIFKLFSLYRFIDYFQIHSKAGFANTWKEYLKADWPTLVFVAVMIFVLIVLPIVTFGEPLAYFSIIYLINILFALFTLVSFQYILLEALSKAGKYKLFSGLQKKKW